MAPQPHHDPHRPLLDPVQLEEAGRALRQWLDRLLSHAQAQDDTEIEWEDGELRHDRRNDVSTGH